MAIDLDGDTNPDCDTKSGGAGTTCIVSSSARFTLEVSLNSIPGDLAGGGYVNWLVRTDNSTTGLRVKNRAGTSEVVAPDCQTSVESKQPELGNYQVNCQPSSASVFTGVLVEIDFKCTADSSNETIALIHSLGAMLIGDLVGGHAEAGPDSLTIDCQTFTAVGGIAELPDADAATPSAVENPSGLSPGQIAAVTFGSVASAVALVGAGWYLTRRRLRS